MWVVGKIEESGNVAKFEVQYINKKTNTGSCNVYANTVWKINVPVEVPDFSFPGQNPVSFSPCKVHKGIAKTQHKGPRREKDVCTNDSSKKVSIAKTTALSSITKR